MAIHFHQNTLFHVKQKNVLKRWIRSTASQYKPKLGELNIILLTDDELLKINQEHLNHDYYTDIITFDYSSVNEVVGDLFISIDRVSENAKQMQNRIENELHRVIIHGVLHLCGLLDKTPLDKENMTLAEDKALVKLETLFHVKYE